MPAVNAKPLASDPRCVIADLLRGCITHNHACRLVEMGLAADTSARAHYTSPQCHLVSTGTQKKPLSAVIIYCSKNSPLVSK
jgi:hypothetical protein